jgi:hypothetical protein
MAIPAQEIILPGDFEVSVALGADRTPPSDRVQQLLPAARQSTVLLK